MIKHNIPCMTTLDSFQIPPQFKDKLIEIVYDALDEVDGWFLNQINRIEKETGIKMDKKPKEARTVEIQRTGNIF